MIIFWLSAMGAIAAKRGDFNTDVLASCWNDGSAINSGHCTISKRAGVATYGALGILSGVAGISAIIMYVQTPHLTRSLQRLTVNLHRLLFVATFAYVCHSFRLSWASSQTDAEKQAGAPGTNNTTVQYHQQGVEMQPHMPAQQQGQPLLNQQQGGYSAEQQPKWAEAQQYPQHAGYSQQGAPEPQYNQNQPCKCQGYDKLPSCHMPTEDTGRFTSL